MLMGGSPPLGAGPAGWLPEEAAVLLGGSPLLVPPLLEHMLLLPLLLGEGGPGPSWRGQAGPQAVVIEEELEESSDAEGGGRAARRGAGDTDGQAAGVAGSPPSERMQQGAAGAAGVAASPPADAAVSSPSEEPRGNATGGLAAGEPPGLQQVDDERSDLRRARLALLAEVEAMERRSEEVGKAWAHARECVCVSGNLLVLASTVWLELPGSIFTHSWQHLYAFLAASLRIPGLRQGRLKQSACVCL